VPTSGGHRPAPTHYTEGTPLAQISVKINGYAYTVGCDDGQERHLVQMAADVEARIDSIKTLGGQSGEARLLVLAALLMADELYEQRQALQNMQAELTRLPQAEAEAKKRLARLADRAEEIAQGLEQP
jgi:cell division protein ZapA